MTDVADWRESPVATNMANFIATFMVDGLTREVLRMTAEHVSPRRGLEAMKEFCLWCFEPDALHIALHIADAGVRERMVPFCEGLRMSAAQFALGVNADANEVLAWMREQCGHAFDQNIAEQPM